MDVYQTSSTSVVWSSQMIWTRRYPSNIDSKHAFQISAFNLCTIYNPKCKHQVGNKSFMYLYINPNQTLAYTLYTYIISERDTIYPLGDNIHQERIIYSIKIIDCEMFLLHSNSIIIEFIPASRKIIVLNNNEFWEVLYYTCRDPQIGFHVTFFRGCSNIPYGGGVLCASN